MICYSFSVVYFLRPPPSLRLWRYCRVSFFRGHVFDPPLPFQVIWRWFSTAFFSVPHGGAFLSFPFYLARLVGFVTSPFRGVGVGFEEPHLRLRFKFVEPGFLPFFSYFCMYGSSEWGCITVLPWINLTRSVITWEQVMGLYWYCLGGISSIGTHGIWGEARAPAQSSIVQRRIKLLHISM